MARSEAQKAADKKYAQKVKGQTSHFGVNLKCEEYQYISDTLEQFGMTKADFLRWAVEELKRQRQQP